MFRKVATYENPTIAKIENKSILYYGVITGRSLQGENFGLNVYNYTRYIKMYNIFINFESIFK